MPIGVYPRTEYHRRIIGKNMRGKHHTEATKKLMREKAQMKVGILNNRWKGGSVNYFHEVARAIYFEHNTNLICEFCSSPNSLHIHHKDNNHKNNSLKNLQALCATCHQRIHHLGKKRKTFRV